VPTASACSAENADISAGTRTPEFQIIENTYFTYGPPRAPYVGWEYEAMLRITNQLQHDTLTMFLEGRLTGNFAQEIRNLAERCVPPPQIIVDLTEVTFVDATGEEILLWLNRYGVLFIARSGYSQHVCEQLQIRLSQTNVPTEKRYKAVAEGAADKASGGSL